MDVEAQTSSSAAASSSAGGEKEAELFGKKRNLDAKMIAEEHNMEKTRRFIRPGVDTRTGVAVLNVRSFCRPCSRTRETATILTDYFWARIRRQERITR